ncbi:MAG: lasso peptide biosynthesis B2 protein [Dehalococcoidia bacterium]|nr:lasso peptide biosynthesis B2 protein [Dehalococcoidia bacterium]
MKWRAALDTARALRLLATTTLMFRLGGPGATARATREAREMRSSDAADVELLGVDVWRVARAVWRAKRIWPLEVKCLQTALVTHEMFRAKGLRAPVCIGTRLEAGRVRAHAWVELAGWIVDDQQVTSDRSAHMRFASGAASGGER